MNSDGVDDEMTACDLCHSLDVLAVRGDDGVVPSKRALSNGKIDGICEARPCRQYPDGARLVFGERLYVAALQQPR